MYFLEFERLLVHVGPLTDSLELPRRDIREIRIVALGFAIWRLTFLAEMPAARFAPLERIERQQFGEFQIVGDTSSVFEALVQIIRRPRDRDRLPEFFA